MAFCQPVLAPAIRQPVVQDLRNNPTTIISSPLHRELEQAPESPEWILFPACSSPQTQTASTICTPTAGLSRLSDFGSLDTKSRQDEDILCKTTNGSVDDDEDLDSLDEGLHAFQEPSLMHRAGLFEPSTSVLPRHDGLGTFPTSSPPLQEQLWHFERFNPRKRSIVHHRRRSSVQRRIDAVEDHDTMSIEAATRERIEQWRMEQSKVLLDEIERETRRRRSSVISQRAEMTPGTARLEQIIKGSVAENTGDEATTVPLGACSPVIEDSESFWQRITRRVIRDFIGIDDTLLSVIFGEALPTDRPEGEPPSESSPSKSSHSDNSVPACAGAGWEGRLLDRLSRELGILLQQLTEHPGPFSTLSTRFNPSTSDYAGMPVTTPTSSRSQSKHLTPSGNTAASFEFRPTLQDASLPTQNSAAESTHAALWGIEEEESAPATPEDDCAYWEQSPDIKTVFRFLHNRFTSQRRPATTSKPPLNVANTSTPDSLRRAAIIRQYHPLVSRAAATWDQRHGQARRHSLRRNGGSSCASSVAVSARRTDLRGGSLGSSSRNYWDLGGSTVGSGGGSVIGVGGGGMGAWGEI